MPFRDRMILLGLLAAAAAFCAWPMVELVAANTRILFS